MMKKSKLITKAWKQMSSRVAKHRATAAEKPHIPHDVPKGHLVVYVGKEEESYKRFVIKITLLHDPIIRALLDQSKDEAYDDSLPEILSFVSLATKLSSSKSSAAPLPVSLDLEKSLSGEAGS